MSELREHLKSYANKFEFENDVWRINNELYDRNYKLVEQREEMLSALKLLKGDIDWHEGSPTLRMLNKLIAKMEKP